MERQVLVVSDNSSDESENEDDDAAKYGYGDAAPDSEAAGVAKMPRRLSSRAEAGRRVSRSSISRQQPLNLSGEDENDENLPFHPKRTPRRSSMKNSCPVRAQRRRASIGTPGAGGGAERRMSIEEELEIGTILPSQVLEVKLPMRRESIKRRRSIQFNEDVNVRKIQPVSKVKGAKKNELWFQDDEYHSIKKKTRALLEKVDSNGVVNGKKYCTRGLEKYMEDPAKRARDKYAAWDSVLMEQEMQRKLQIYDDETLGKFYRRTSLTSTLEAADRANADAEEVAMFYKQQEENAEQRDTVEEMAQQRRRRGGRRASIA
jgi:hypothetical protein